MHNVYSNINAKRIIKCFRLIALIFLLTTLGLFATVSARSPILTRGNNDWSVSKVSPQEQLVGTGTIRGHVTASDGRSLEGLQLRAFPTGTFNIFDAFVDSSGMYEFANIPVGTYQLLYKPIYVPPNNNDAFPDYLAEWYDNKPYLPQYIPDYVTVIANMVTDNIDAELQLGGIITGSVLAEDSNEPVADIKVTAYRSGGGGFQAITDKEGHYRLSGLRGGNYTICFGTLFQYLNRCYDNSDGAHAQLIAVTEGVTIANIDTKLTVGALVRGKVTSEQTGLGIAGVVVSTTGGLHCVPCRDVTDADGFYQLTGLTASTYTVSFDGSGTGASLFENGEPVAPYFNKSYSVTVPATSTTTITLDVSLQSALNLVGQISVEPADGSSVYPFVNAYDTNGQIVAFGRFFDGSQEFFVSGLSPGVYRIGIGEWKYDSDLYDYYPEYYNDKPTFEGSDPITITVGNVVSLTVTLTRRARSNIQLATSATLTDVIVAKQFHTLDKNAALRYSIDGGMQWQSLISEPWITSTTTINGDSAFTLVPRGDLNFPIRIIRASKIRGNQTVYRTGDFGISWSTFALPFSSDCLPELGQTDAGIFNSPSNPTRIYLIGECYYLINDQGMVTRARLFTSSNAGIDWQDVTSPTNTLWEVKRFIISPVLPDRIYITKYAVTAQSHLMLRQSDDAGASWSKEQEIPVSEIEFDWAEPQKIYGIEDKDTYTVYSGFYGGNNAHRYTGKRSNDGGATWVDWQEQPCRTSFLKFMALQQPNTLLMHCLQGLYRSSNGGDHWEKLPETVDELIAVDYGNRNRIFGQRQGLLYASLDQGSTWTALADWHSSMWLPFVSR